MNPPDVKAAAERMKARNQDRLIFRETCREAFELVVWQSDLPELIQTKDAAEIGARFLRALEFSKQAPVEWEQEAPLPKPRRSEEEIERVLFNRSVL